MGIERLRRFKGQAGSAADYLQNEREATARMERRADALLEALREVWPLVHPGDREFSPKAAALLAKYGEKS